MSTDNISSKDGCVGESGYFRINVPGTIGLFSTVEGLAWEVAGPHERLVESTLMAITMFGTGGEAEQVGAEALRDVWNRILGRNLARAEGAAHLMLSAGREALQAAQEAQCEMAAQAIEGFDPSDIFVPDGQ